jgi:hypothetical protein
MKFDFAAPWTQIFRGSDDPCVNQFGLKAVLEYRLCMWSVTGQKPRLHKQITTTHAGAGRSGS